MAGKRLRKDGAHPVTKPSFVPEPDRPGRAVRSRTPRTPPPVVPVADPPQVVTDPHLLERLIQKELLSQPGVRFASLTVRRVRDGICLQGVLDVEDALPDFSRVAREVAGVERVLNHLVVRQNCGCTGSMPNPEPADSNDWSPNGSE